MLKGATILHSLFIWWINFFLTCVNELIWMCKHQEKVRSNQASISINSCTELSKTQLFPVIIIKEFFFLFYIMFWSRDFQARWENYVMKNEKWIVFPESRYVNSNPATFLKIIWWQLLIPRSKRLLMSSATLSRKIWNISTFCK